MLLALLRFLLRRFAVADALTCCSMTSVAFRAHRYVPSIQCTLTQSSARARDTWIHFRDTASAVPRRSEQLKSFDVYLSSCGVVRHGFLDAPGEFPDRHRLFPDVGAHTAHICWAGSLEYQRHAYDHI
jgi:hypothetical protein